MWRRCFSPTAIKAAIIALLTFLSLSCHQSSAKVQVETIDRATATSIMRADDPLRLEIEIKDDGTLLLNNIETGNISDPTEIAERLAVIFADRRQAGIDQRRILINSAADVNGADFERLIKCLAAVNASPVEVISDGGTNGQIGY
jgi:biopolymer transport protein ExbD